MDIGALEVDEERNESLHRSNSLPQVSSSYPPTGLFHHFFAEQQQHRASTRERAILIPRDQARKAIDVLGINLTDEKLMDKLGVDEPTLQQAKEILQEDKDRAEMRIRMRLPTNKTGLNKALKVLGEDPSRKKIMDKLGIDEIELHDVEREIHQALWEKVGQTGARASYIANKKDYKKALSVLGYDPTAEKLKALYGIPEYELQAAIAKQRELSPLDLADFDSSLANRFIPDKITSKKALQVLGVDPTKEKLRNMYGIDDEELNNAEAQRLLIAEERFNQQEHIRTHVPDRYSTRKACNVLGISPSEQKAMATFGVDRETLEEARDEAEKQRTQTFIEDQKRSLTRGSLRLRGQGGLDVGGITGAEKALMVLGFNPSLHRAMMKLGMSEEELQSLQEQGDAMARLGLDDTTMASPTSPASPPSPIARGEGEEGIFFQEDEDPIVEAKRKYIPDKTSATQKAISILGIDTKEKLANKLGIAPEELRQAELDARRSVTSPQEPAQLSPGDDAGVIEEEGQGLAGFILKKLLG